MMRSKNAALDGKTHSICIYVILYPQDTSPLVLWTTPRTRCMCTASMAAVWAPSMFLAGSPDWPVPPTIWWWPTMPATSP
ncbi:hypothetical protein M5D96_007787 [Drosophila gunungcola]|uniref:Uncharacterized protein n=1 Tax=Drosophila gunungcola TaxID=103775 RepID=A0A9P9YL99_9MUSC|nr:hypothetical protein M5D96_007787 [Drosophila gunungcola]